MMKFLTRIELMILHLSGLITHTLLTRLHFPPLFLTLQSLHYPFYPFYYPYHLMDALLMEDQMWLQNSLRSSSMCLRTSDSSNLRRV
jgi:hypothetical protein